MMNSKTAKYLFIPRRRIVLKIVFFILTVSLMGNLNALVDAVLHPEIPYFDEEHLIVGGVAVLFIAILLVSLEIHIYRLELALQLLERLRYQKELILNSAGEGIFGLDQNRKYSFVNPSAAKMLGYEVEKLIGQPCHAVCHHTKKDRRPYPEEECPIYATCKDGAVCHMKGEVFWRKNNTSFQVEYTSAPIIEAGKLVGAVVTFNDVTEHERMEEELRALTLIDELTGLYNRRGFFTLTGQELKIAERMKKRMLLLFADVDNLRLINDTFGHHEGDQALIDTANILKETFRESDIIARIGGDEFVILAIETADTSTDTLNIRLQDNIKSHNANGGRSFKLSISIGVTHYDPETPSSIEELLTRADKLMYEQKRNRQSDSA